MCGVPVPKNVQRIGTGGTASAVAVHCGQGHGEPENAPREAVGRGKCAAFQCQRMCKGLDLATRLQPWQCTAGGEKREDGRRGKSPPRSNRLRRSRFNLRRCRPCPVCAVHDAKGACSACTARKHKNINRAVGGGGEAFWSGQSTVVCGLEYRCSVSVDCTQTHILKGFGSVAIAVAGSVPPDAVLLARDDRERVPDAMIQIVGKDWYPDPTGSGSRQQVERCREDARKTP